MPNLDDITKAFEEGASSYKSTDIASAFDEGIRPKTASEAIKAKAEKLLQGAETEVSTAGQSALDTLKGLGAGVVEGATLGGTSELGAGLQTILAKLGGSIDIDKELAAKGFTGDLVPSAAEYYRKAQKEEQARLQDIQKKAPTAFGAGELVGTLGTGLATAGSGLSLGGGRIALKEALKQGGKTALAEEIAKRAGISAIEAAPFGAVQSALSSEKGAIIGATPEEKQQLLKETLSGAGTASLYGAAISAASDIVPPLAKAGYQKLRSTLDKYTQESPLLRQMSKAAEFGEQGIDITKEKFKMGGETPLVKRDTDTAKSIVDNIYSVDRGLGESVGNAINNATEQGKTINITDDLRGAAKDFYDLFKSDATIAANPYARRLEMEIFKLQKNQLTPKEIKSIQEQVSALANNIQSKSPDIANIGFQFATNINNALKDQLPQYRNAAERFESFRRLVPETIISGGTPQELSGVRLGDLKNDESKLFNAVKNMIQGASKEGTATMEAKESLINLGKNLKQFEQEEGKRLASKQIEETAFKPGGKIESAEQMINKIKGAADESAMFQYAWGVSPHGSPVSSLKSAAIGVVDTGKGQIIGAAGKYGLYKKKAGELSKSLYQATDDELRGVASKIKQIPGISIFGEALEKGLDKKDIAAKNAAIFTILQNPKARQLLDEETLKEQ